MWFCSTMATRSSRSKWEIESPNLYWRKLTHHQWRRCKGHDSTVRGTGGFGSTGVSEKRNDTDGSKEKKNELDQNERTVVEGKGMDSKNETLKGDKNIVKNEDWINEEQKD